MASKYPGLPLLSAEELHHELLPELLQWSLTNGLTIYPSDFKSYECNVINMTVYPTPMPRNSFEAAIDVQLEYNKLYATIAQDADGWLSKETQKLSEFDPDFTGKLWALYLKAKEIGMTQKIGMGIFRSDYLIDGDNAQIKQVEFNTVSVSFGGLSSKVSELHSYLNASGKYANGKRFYDLEVPISNSAECITNGMANAIKKYNAVSKAKDSIVVFVVQKSERNVFDQRLLEYNLFKQHGILSKRLTIHEIHTKIILEPTKKKLYLKSTGQEVGLVYFRAGYTPNDYVTEQDWENRLLLETSFAIKAPNLLTQLSGTKKIQQLLADKSILSRFASSDEIEKLYATFVKMYPLDESELGKEGKRLALEEPSSFVLKPQREGGGNNIYKEDIPKFLATIPEKDWSAYILMELIAATPTNGNVIAREGELVTEPILSELGIFGCVLFDDKNIYDNVRSGWLLRSKIAVSNEGGVAAGFGCIDSPVLY
ncbi:HBL054Cp [Eremothecium sinecaudum]|uniref:Glutathione synthetase n=1 Tax=Eremothecium sinecaudum TaxID=45286 RepID=A0A109UWM6_9SACH|nr:HBL054Cp [Eremothecium sinecaudum]AMD18848.1 HBL054Cp [Eremothecium sinecaudum]